MRTLVIAVAATFALAAILLTIVPWRRVDAVAREFLWHRSIDINHQVWKQVTESRTRPPGNARNVRMKKKVIWVSTSTAARQRGISSTTSQVIAVYSYEEPYWRLARKVTADGEGQAGASWPHYTLSNDERVGQRTEVYKTIFQDTNGKQYAKKLRESKWRSLEPGSTYTLRLNAAGFILRINEQAHPPRSA